MISQSKIQQTQNPREKNEHFQNNDQNKLHPMIDDHPRLQLSQYLIQTQRLIEPPAQHKVTFGNTLRGAFIMDGMLSIPVNRNFVTSIGTKEL